jgi:hypothetical protein
MIPYAYVLLVVAVAVTCVVSFGVTLWREFGG